MMTAKRFLLIAAIGSVTLDAPSVMAQAQPSVSDVVGGLTWAEPADGRAAVELLLERGAAAVKAVTAMLQEPGKGDDANARFALQGLAMHVMRNGAEAERSMVAAVLVDALAAQQNPELKAFLVGKLQLVGRDDAVPALAPLLEDERLYEPATLALIRIGSPAATAALRGALGRAQGKRLDTLIRALGQLRDAASKDAVLAHAKSADRSIRLAAWYALASIGDPAFGPVLAPAVTSKDLYERSRAARDYLLFAQRRLEAGDRAAAVAVCRELLAVAATPANRHAVCGALATLVDALAVEAVPELGQAVSAGDWQVREAALKLAEELPADPVVAEFAKVAETAADPAVAAAVITMFGRRADPAALPAVSRALSHGDATVRNAAIVALPRFGPASLQPLLEVVCSGATEDVAAARQSLTTVSCEGFCNSVVAAIDKAADADRKAALIGLLASRNATEQAPTVVALTADADAGVRKAALNALETVARIGELPPVLQLLLTTESGSDRAGAQRVLAAICRRDDAALDPILQAQQKASGQPRSALCGTLAMVGGDRALQAVLADVGSQDKERQDAAVRALTDWKDAGAAPHLLTLARESTNEVHRVLSLRGYVRLAGEVGRGNVGTGASMLKDAMSVAKTAADKKLVLGGLGKLRDAQALALVAAALDDAELVEEAAVAAVNIVCPRDKRDNGVRSVLAYEALTNVVEKAKTKQVVDKARAHLATMPPPNTANVALGRPVKTSIKHEADKVPEKAVDGNTDKLAAWFGAGSPCWLEVDLGKPTAIDTVRPIFYWDGRRYYQYTVDVSVDGETWTKVADNSGNTSPSTPDGYIHRFTAVDARYVRLNVSKNSSNPSVHVAEFEVYASGKAPKVFKTTQAAAAPVKAPPLPAPDKDGFIPLFNGTDLTGWMGSVNGYEAKDGVMACKEKGGGGLLTAHQFGDFVLKFGFKLTPGANNGLAIRTPASGNAAYAGMELQIIDNVGYEKHHNYKLNPWQVHGSIYGVVPAKTGALKPAGEWNQQEVRALGRKITVILNDQTIVDADLSTITETADGKGLKAHPGLARHKGHIGWLGHGARVEFRDIKIKPIDPYTTGPHNVPPEGFTALFNGKDLSGWKGLVANPEKRAAMKPEELAAAQKSADDDMRAHWKIEDDTLVFDGKGKALCTVKDYADFEMFVDWKIKENGDSGIYLRGSPQVQIWDLNKHPEGSGGLYNNQKNPRNPLACADNPIEQWNRFRILMVGERVTVWLNGEKVVDNVVMENYWNRKIPIYPSGQLELQNHGNTLWFRNVYVREIPREAAKK